MNDAIIRDLARRAGIAVDWTDYANRRHRVPLDAVRRILKALGLPCDTPEEASHSRHSLTEPHAQPLITATVGQAVTISAVPPNTTRHVRLVREDGSAADLPIRRAVGRFSLPGIEEVGYHTIEIGEHRLTLAVAPHRCVTISDIAPAERLWGLAVQMYGLRHHGDCGIGDTAGVTELCKAAASLKADALALSPTHALFAADPNHFSPYSPSSRLFHNPLHGNAATLFGEARVARAAAEAGCADEAGLDANAQIDWIKSTRLKMRRLRRLFDDFSATDLAATAGTPLAADFAKFCADRGPALERHALFEALHAAQLAANPQAHFWKDWPRQWQQPGSAAVADFAQTHRQEIRFHCFLQWIADRSLAAAQQQTRTSGMRIGLIADLAIGTDRGGSHCWASQEDMLVGLEIGAPPDLFNSGGQSWGLTTFSPRALAATGFAPFLETLRACMRHAGGVRIDHAMGMMRLWVIPHGAKASEGAYLSYPLQDLLRLTALESRRHRAIVIGEDLGTVPAGFRAHLDLVGIYGMRVLWFERDNERFIPPKRWAAGAVAMTSTHDLPTIAGWWAGCDIEVRAQCGLVADAKAEQSLRAKDREALWRAFRSTKATAAEELPAPQQGVPVADAAFEFIARTPCRLALLPLEDALALREQPNLPATVDEHPNWRRRYSGEAGALLNADEVRRRCRPLARRERQ